MYMLGDMLTLTIKDADDHYKDVSGPVIRLLNNGNEAVIETSEGEVATTDPRIIGIDVN